MKYRLLTKMPLNLKWEVKSIKNKLKIGIVGLGFISAMHLEGYAKCSEVELTAFCDIIPERAYKAAAKYGVPGVKVYVDYREMIANEVKVSNLEIQIGASTIVMQQFDVVTTIYMIPGCIVYAHCKDSDG